MLIEINGTLPSNPALICRDELSKTIDFIKSKLSEEDYKTLKEKHNFDVLPIVLKK